MKYIGLLRGINVGGNSLIKMIELKAAFEKSGYTNVVTYINSGNVIFQSDEKDVRKITKTLEKNLSQEFGMLLRVVVRSHNELQEIVSNVPSCWTDGSDVRKYISFILEPSNAKDIAQEIDLREGVDELKIGKQVLYMTTKMSGLTKSGFTKMIGKKIYKEMTMRNFNTVEKIWGIMEKV
jgi:uncharacterized protein (DUF1697 family)